MSREQPGNALSDDQPAGFAGRVTPIPEVVEPSEDASADPPYDPDAEAVAFVRFCYRRRAVQWPELYDEMCAVAARGAYNGMDYEQLRNVGIGFALAALPRLAELAARVIAEERSPQSVAAFA